MAGARRANLAAPSTWWVRMCPGHVWQPAPPGASGGVQRELVEVTPGTGQTLSAVPSVPAHAPEDFDAHAAAAMGRSEPTCFTPSAVECLSDERPAHSFIDRLRGV